METYEPVFNSIIIGDEIFECPKTEYEWLYPERFIGQNLVWFFANHICIDDFASRETINKFFRIWDNWMTLTHVLHVATGHELVSTVENCRDYITDEDLQEQLIRTIQPIKNLKPYAGYMMFVRRTKNEELRKLRHTIWSLLK